MVKLKVHVLCCESIVLLHQRQKASVRAGDVYVKGKRSSLNDRKRPLVRTVSVSGTRKKSMVAAVIMVRGDNKEHKNLTCFFFLFFLCFSYCL